MKSTIEISKISPNEVHYAEAHGTGTMVGDPIEAKSISSAYCSEKRTSPLFVGSSKSNIGHGESLAGVVGFIKTALCVEKGQLVPNLHFKNPNPNIPFEQYQLQVVTKLQGWDKPIESRIAAVNSFGFGGSNSHVIVKGYKPCVSTVKATKDASIKVVPITAKSPESMNLNCISLKNYLQQNRDTLRLDDISYTMSETREHHSLRTAFQVSSLEQLEKGLQEFINNTASSLYVTGAASKRTLVYVFTGMGAQWPGMGRELLESDSAFRQAVQMFDEHFQKISGWSIIQLLQSPLADWNLDKTSVSQAMIVAVQIGIIESLKRRGIVPGVVVGHSVGELAAAYAGGLHKKA